MSVLILGVGLVLVIEGLVLALLPDRLEELLVRLMSIPPETRRLLGLAAMAGGTILVAISGLTG